MLLVHAWIIPELYAARGANVVRARAAVGQKAEYHASAGQKAQMRALGLLGDLVEHRPRELYARTGLLVERGELGVWLVGEVGAILVRPGGRRVNCYCVKVAEKHGEDLPSGDRTAHLLLALRADEAGLVTVANLSFSGARWRLRRRLPARAHEALEVAAGLAREPAHLSTDRERRPAKSVARTDGVAEARRRWHVGR